MRVMVVSIAVWMVVLSGGAGLSLWRGRRVVTVLMPGVFSSVVRVIGALSAAM